MAYGYNSGGYSGSGYEGKASTMSVLQRVRQSQQRKLEEERQANFARNKRNQNLGKAGIKLHKSLRDWQYAKLSDPSMNYLDFMKDPAIGGQHAKKGIDKIIAGDAKRPGFFQGYGDLIVGGPKRRWAKHKRNKVRDELWPEKDKPSWLQKFKNRNIKGYDEKFNIQEMMKANADKLAQSKIVTPVDPELVKFREGLSRGYIPVGKPEHSEEYLKKQAQVQQEQAKQKLWPKRKAAIDIMKDKDVFAIDPANVPDVPLSPGEAVNVEGMKGFMQRLIPGGKTGKTWVGATSNVPTKPELSSEDLLKIQSGADTATSAANELATQKHAQKLTRDFKLAEAESGAINKSNIVADEAKRIYEDKTYYPMNKRAALHQAGKKNIPQTLKTDDKLPTTNMGNIIKSKIEGTGFDQFKDYPKQQILNDMPDDTIDIPDDNIPDLMDLYEEELATTPTTGGPMTASLASDTYTATGDVLGTDATSIPVDGTAPGKMIGDTVSGLSLANKIAGGKFAKGDTLDVAQDVTGATQVGSKIATQMGQKAVGKTLGSAAGKVAAPLAIAQSAKTLISKDSSDVQKAGAVMSAAGAVAMTNFWNPAGWVAGALAVGGSLLQMFGGKNKKQKRSVRSATGYRGGTMQGY
jgi:uncharacterized protein (DUF736 family)